MTLEYEWSEELSDPSSTEYLNFSRDVTDFLSNILKESYGADFFSVEVYNFRQGSVVFDLRAYFKASTNATAHMLTEVMKARKAGSKFNIIAIELKQSYPCIQVCATTNQPKSETWIFKYVSIAFGVVITVLLVIILLLVVQNKRLKESHHGSTRPSMFREDDSFHVSTPVFNAAPPDMFQMSAPTETLPGAPYSICRDLKTFTPEEKDSNGSINIAFTSKDEKTNDQEEDKEKDTNENTFI